MYAGGESRPNGVGVGGGGDGGGGGDALRRRRQPGPSASPGAAAASSSSSSSSSRGAEAEEEEEEGVELRRGEKQARRKKQQQGRREAVARAIRGGLPSCWGGVSVVQERRTGRRWSRRQSAPADRDAAGGDDGPVPGAGAGTATAAAAWCCVCPGGDCSLEPNPSANGKEDPGVRSLLERNDFYSADCNPHADVLPAGADTAAGYDSSS